MKDLVKTLSEFIGFPFEISTEKSKETEVTVSEEDEEENEEEGWAGSRRPVSLSPCRKTPRCTRGGQARHEVHFRLEGGTVRVLGGTTLGQDSCLRTMTMNSIWELAAGVFHRAERRRDGTLGGQARHDDHLFLEGGRYDA